MQLFDYLPAVSQIHKFIGGQDVPQESVEQVLIAGNMAYNFHQLQLKILVFSHNLCYISVLVR